MKDIYQYFNLIDGVLKGSGAEIEELEWYSADGTAGVIDGVLYFYDGGRLEFTENVFIWQGRPIKEEYRYEYVKAGSHVFRYDNVRHHPELPNFPHHKHVGRKTISAIEPTLDQVLDEIVKLMVMQPVSAPTTVKRRRARTPRQR